MPDSVYCADYTGGKPRADELTSKDVACRKCYEVFSGGFKEASLLGGCCYNTVQYKGFLAKMLGPER
jgi:hypothetical protein